MMEQQSYRIELLGNESGASVFNEHIAPAIAGTLVTLEMVTIDDFSNKQSLFIDVLREVFTQKFGEYFKVTLSGKYHPTTGTKGPRYDLGLTIGGGEEGIYPIQVELLGQPSDHVTLH